MAEEHSWQVAQQSTGVKWYKQLKGKETFLYALLICCLCCKILILKADKLFG